MISNIRLSAQQLHNPTFNTPLELVEWMGAIQAQDYNMAKWAIAIRLKEASLKELNSALERGDIIRTHILRPTWHFVSKNDIRWMMMLSGKRIQAANDSYGKQLNLSKENYNKHYKLLEKMLESNPSLTKQEIAAEFEQHGISTEAPYLNRILAYAETNCLICSGVDKNKKATYSLFDERVPPVPEVSKEEALAMLATKYFGSHSPATLADFSWWSGLPITEVRKAISLISNELVKETIDGQEFFIHSSCNRTAPDGLLHLLPSFDEYLISYKDRTAAIELKHYPKAFNNFGTFYPVIMQHGKVIGNWKKVLKKGAVTVETSFFNKSTKVDKALLKLAEKRYSDYWEK